VKHNNKVALILCGGDINFSDLPIVTNRSNAMIPVNGRPVIGWILEDLLQKGFSEVVLVLRFDNTRLFNYVTFVTIRT
jgi:NDP-sugar pyrophosphorylase family protein